MLEIGVKDGCCLFLTCCSIIAPAYITSCSIKSISPAKCLEVFVKAMLYNILFDDYEAHMFTSPKTP